MDHLVERGLTCIAVLDVSAAALERARTRLAARQTPIRWIEADVTADWPRIETDIWHDRAVFHFLTEEADRRRYISRLRSTVKPGGSALIATFAPEGPPRCSGLPVVRYSPESLRQELGAGFRLADSIADEHRTPAGVAQPFWFSRFVVDDTAPGPTGR